MLVKDIFAGPRASNPLGLVLLDELLFFAAHDEPHGSELWRSDGTPEGTSLVLDIEPGTRSSRPQRLWTLEPDLVLFEACRASRCGAWQSDGTSEGTIPVGVGSEAEGATDD